MPSQVFVSCSFADEDLKVVETIKNLFATPTLASFEAMVVDARSRSAERVETKILDAIDKADIVVGVFTRRHETSAGVYTPPSYVISEVAYALAKKKRLLIFKEDGISDQEMGLVDSTGLEWTPFNRASMDNISFVRQATDYIRSALTRQFRAIEPPHRYGPVKIEYTVYPGGYATSQFSYDVHVSRPDPIIHELGIVKVDPNVVPSAEELIRNAETGNWPIPNESFVVVASDVEGLHLRPFPTQEIRSRRFKLEIPPDTRELKYDILWGDPFEWSSDRQVCWFGYLASRRHVTMVDITLRIHRSLTRVPPRVNVKISGDDAGIDDETVVPRYKTAPLRMMEIRPIPFFRVYRLTLNDIPTGADIDTFY